MFRSALRNDFSHLAIAMLCRAARFFTTQKFFAHREIWEVMGARAKKNRCMSTGFQLTRRQRKAAGSVKLGLAAASQARPSH
ncbi:hypothetical protein [Paraburkholderia caledonica]|uniref:Secreted protein n=1 Tax=Paraburkholderia caledonica TaxID=134536 RepID=A0AB73IA21_9BURK|nr:hypothetical protein [Paraburkholderia caledonica]